MNDLDFGIDSLNPEGTGEAWCRPRSEPPVTPVSEPHWASVDHPDNVAQRAEKKRLREVLQDEILVEVSDVVHGVFTRPGFASTLAHAYDTDEFPTHPDVENALRDAIGECLRKAFGA